MEQPLSQESALAELNSVISGIMDQALKNQWWNVINRTITQLLPLALRRFDAVLKGNG